MSQPLLIALGAAAGMSVFAFLVLDAWEYVRRKLQSENAKNVEEVSITEKEKDIEAPEPQQIVVCEKEERQEVQNPEEEDGFSSYVDTTNSFLEAKKSFERAVKKYHPSS